MEKRKRLESRPKMWAENVEIRTEGLVEILLTHKGTGKLKKSVEKCKK